VCVENRKEKNTTLCVFYFSFTTTQNTTAFFLIKYLIFYEPLYGIKKVRIQIVYYFDKRIPPTNFINNYSCMMVFVRFVCHDPKKKKSFLQRRKANFKVESREKKTLFFFYNKKRIFNNFQKEHPKEGANFNRVIKKKLFLLKKNFTKFRKERPKEGANFKVLYYMK
jgi:hypothetical protein